MKISWKAKTVIIFLLIALYIAFPFFCIKYFETAPAYKQIFTHFLIPIFIIAFLGTLFVYLKYFRRSNKRTNSKVKTALQDFFTMSILTVSVSAILIGWTLSTIVLTNAYFGKSKEINISAKILTYEPYITKWGRLRHYITIINPLDSAITKLEVYKKYNAGEIFNKQMKIGKWNQLYSFD